jgi:uncharacterized protein (TIGR02996 family)
MAAYDDLLQAVLDNPSDDAPRLVMADYLDEHGSPLRAEFIRTQIAMAQCKIRSKKYQALCVKERELWEAKGKDDWAISFNESAEFFPHGIRELRHQDSYDRLPFLQLNFPSYGNQASRSPIRTLHPPIFAWRRGFVYYFSDMLETIRQVLPLLLTYHPITHAVAFDGFPATRSDTNRSPFHWIRQPDSPPNQLLNNPSFVPADLVDQRLDIRFESPQEAMLTLSATLVDEAKAKRDKSRDAGRSVAQ